MGKFVLARVAQALISLVLVSVVIFLVVRLTGDPLLTILPEEAEREQFDRMREFLGLDRPVAVQYFSYMGNVLTGDFGESIRTRSPVGDLLWDRLPATLELGLLAMGISFILAIPLGVYAASRPGSPLDIFARMFAVLGQSIPAFWLGILLIQLFAVQWDLLPAGGRGSPEQLILPALTLGLFLMAGFMRLTRSAMLEVLGSEYIKAARLKGVSQQKVLWRHAFPNAAVPVLTFGALITIAVLTGSVVVETVFAWPGLGRLVVDAIRARDFPIVQGAVLIFSVFYIAGNLFVDIAYAYLNPRIRY